MFPTSPPKSRNIAQEEEDESINDSEPTEVPPIITILHEFHVKKKGTLRRLTIESHKYINENEIENEKESTGDAQEQGQSQEQGQGQGQQSAGEDDKQQPLFPNEQQTAPPSTSTTSERYYLRICKRLFFGNIRKPRQPRKDRHLHTSHSMYSRCSVSDDLSVAGSMASSASASSSIVDTLNPFHHHGSIREQSRTPRYLSAIAESPDSFLVSGEGNVLSPGKGKWTTRSLLLLKDVGLVRVVGKQITLHLRGDDDDGDGSVTSASQQVLDAPTAPEARHFLFRSVEEANEFETQLLQFQKLDDDMMKMKLQKILLHLGGESEANSGVEDGTMRESSNRINADSVYARMSVNGAVSPTSQLALATTGVKSENGLETKTISTISIGGKIMDIEKLSQEQITFLIEIVGCEDLIDSDVGGLSDPYVVAKTVGKMGKILHTTRHIDNSLNPVFTLRKKSFFLWKTSAKQLFLSCDDGKPLQFVIYDYDAVGGHDPLGEVSIPAKDLYAANEERMEYVLNPVLKKAKASKKGSNKTERFVGQTIQRTLDTAESTTKLTGGAVKKTSKIFNNAAKATVGTAGKLGSKITKNGADDDKIATSADRNVSDVTKIGKKLKKARDKSKHKEPLMAGTIAIRCRRATEYDIEFMSKFEEYTKKFGARGAGVLGKDKEDSLLKKFGRKKKRRGELGMGTIQSMLEQKERTTHDEDGEKIPEYKTLPFPDPNDKSGTEWMTAKQIEKAVLAPSRQYQYVGSGKVARIFLEVLACDNLPNMEAAHIFGNKTDAFVKIVYEDCICQTIIIDDKNSPRFLPWTKRAFVLHTNYPSSVINLGVFDYDPGLLNDHDYIGRAAVDVTNLRPGTEYMLNYSLFDTAMSNDRKHQGVIKIRIRVEIDDPRAYLLASLTMPPTIYVNSNTSKDFDCVHQACHGNYDLRKYSLGTIMMLLSELAELGRVTYYVKDFVAGLFFWRSTSKFSIFGKKKISLPLNSICAFIMAIKLVEKPTLLPTFCFFSLGWLLTVAMRLRNAHPNPWRRSPTIRDLFLVLIFGKTRQLSSEKIEIGEGAEEAQRYSQEWADLITNAEKKAAEQAAEIAKEQEELYRELEEGGGANTEIASSFNGPNLTPMAVAKKYLYPIQQTMIIVCEVVRFVRNIILWEEPIYSFWITMISFILSVLFYFVPWAFIVRWFSRLVAWALFGPWMKLLDTSGSPDSEELKEEAYRSTRRKAMQKTIAENRIKNELLIKLRDFKQYFFGKFLTKVPILKLDRYVDFPLPSSSAESIVKEDGATLAEAALAEADKEDHREAGQRLKGLMIPKVAEAEESSNTGNVVSRKSLLRTGDPDVDVAKQSDSYALAAMKIGSVLFFACVLTHFVVPLLVRGVHFLAYSFFSLFSAEEL